MDKIARSEIFAFLIGVIIGGFATNLILTKTEHDVSPVAYSEKYHIHADFLIQTRETVHELGVAELMTTAEQSHHKHAHLHDDDGDVLHMHEEEVSFVEFLDSLEFIIADGCLTLPEGEEFCDSEHEALALYVNDQVWEDEFELYIPQDLDRVLLYFGDREYSPIDEYLQAVPTDACLYSGSCPERGVKPPESCGLTCEL